jgi:prephenate dehydrogenase
MEPQSAPGTTFKRHLAIAHGLMNEDDYLISEILFNPNTPERLDIIIKKMKELKEIVTTHDSQRLAQFLTKVRSKILPKT